MMKYFSIFFLVFSLSVYSQESSLKINSDIGLYNSSINAQLLSQSYGFLDANEKNNIIKALKEKNKIAFESNNTLVYQDRKGWGLSLSNNLGAYANYPKALAEITLLGNEPFKGQTLKLNPLNLMAYHYSQIDFSYQWSKKIKTSIGLLLGHQLATLDVNRADFFTEENAAYINYNLDFESHFSDTTDLRDKLFKNNGFGAAFAINYTDSIEKGSYRITLSDIGFINWNQRTTNALVESQYQFEGINVNDFIAFNDSLIKHELNKAQDELRKSSVESYIWRLPTRLNINFNRSLQSSIVQSYSLYLEHRLGLYDLPKITAEVHKVVKKHTFSLGYHIGGFEPNSFQFNYQFMSKNTHFQIYSRQINSIIPAYNYGLQLGFGIKRVFSNTKQKYRDK